MHDDKRAVGLIGPVGAGKTSYAQRLADQGFANIDCGVILAQRFKEADLRDKEVQEQLERKRRGELVDSAFVVRCIAPLITRAYEEGRSIVLPGSFRTIQECEGLWPVLEQTYGTARFHFCVIHLSLPEAIRRCQQRRVCQHGHSFGINDGDHRIARCPKDDTEIAHRDDDSKEVVTRRYQDYKKTEQEIMHFFYRRLGTIGHLPQESSHGHAQLRHLTSRRPFRSLAANV